MNILVLSQSYPSPGDIYQMMFVHTRVKEYIRQGHDVRVLSFQSDNPYQYEGVEVIAVQVARALIHNSWPDLIISHAPNVRSHLRFLWQNRNSVDKLVFIFHGQESLSHSAHYPPPFEYKKGALYPIKKKSRDCYDWFKQKLLTKIVESFDRKGEVRLVHVSKEFQDNFFADLPLDKKKYLKKSAVLTNPIGQPFIQNTYSQSQSFEADFISIRPFDRPKYGVDIIDKLARNNPNFSFHLFGQGQYFDHFQASENLTIIERFLEHDDIVRILPKYKAGLLPTRQDTQGVMMCEMATFGIPLIVSDIPICREMMDSFYNIGFLDNDHPGEFDLKGFINRIDPDAPINKEKFSHENTVLKEIQFMEKFVSGQSDI
jgi:glycosyltransferase involved in cell wall biosynthesis